MPSALLASRRKGTDVVIAAAAIAVATISGLSRCARGADFTWVPTAGGTYDWGTAANWNPSGVPNNAGDSANLSIGMTGNQTISLNAAFAIGTLSLGSTAAPITTDLTNAGAGNLLFEGSGGTTTLLSGGVAGAVNRISVPVQMDSLTQLDASSTNDLTIAGPLTNAGANRNLNNLAVNKVLRITGQVNLSEVGATAGRALSLNRDTNGDLSAAIREFGDIVISGNIVDGPGGTSSLGLGPIGTLTINRRSTVTLAGNNTFTGNTNANRVNIMLASNSGFGLGTFTPNSSTGAFGPNVLSDNDARTIPNTVQFSQFWTIQGEHSISFTGPMVQANNRAIVNLLSAGKTLTLNDVYGANSLADSRTFVIDGPGRTIINGNVLGTNNTTGTWTGTTLFEKRGSGTVTINGAAAIGVNTYNGGTRIRSGLLEFSQALAYGNTAGITVEAGGAVGLLTGSTDAAFLAKLATGGGAGPSNSAASFSSSGALALAPSDAAVNLNFLSNLGQAGTNLQTMGIGAVSAGVNYTGTITSFNSTYKLGGGGVLTLAGTNQLTGANGVLADNGGTVVISGSNNYTGVTRVGGSYVVPTQGLGQLAGGTNLLNASGISVRVNSALAVNSLAAGGAASSIGSSSNAPTNLVIDGGTFQYVGSGGSTDRQFSIGPNGAVLDSSGSGPVTFSSTAAVTQVSAAARTGTLSTGSYTDGAVTTAVTRVVWASDVSDLTVGMSISSIDLGIPAGTTIIGINPPSYGNWGQTSANGPYQILLSQTASAGANTTGNVSFGNQNRTFTLAGSNAGNNSVAGALTNSATGSLAVAKTGSGKWVLSGNNTYTGLTTISGGSLVLAGNAKNPVLSGAGADLQRGRLVLDYNDTGTSLAPTVKTILTTGYGQTPKFSAGQIRTSNAPASDKGLGWADNAAAKQVTVAYTYYGDANVDGQVDVTDLGALATSWQTSGVWSQGDFDYSGFVDVTDLGALATNWQKGVGNPLARQSLQDALDAVGLSSVSVPEPTTIALLGLCAAGVLARRGRRR